MAFDEGLAQRIREYLARHQGVTERKMFGGLAFMVRGNMCCGVLDDRLMARIGSDQYAQALASPHAGKMDFTGRPLVGFVYVQADGVENDADLGAWIDRCLAFIGNLPDKQVAP